MKDNNARFAVVSGEWEEKQRRSLTYEEFLELFFTRLGRLDDAKTTIELQLTHNMEARMRLRREALEQAAKAQADDELFRSLLPDETDSVMKLLDIAIEFLNQLAKVAEERPLFPPDGQVSLNELVSALSISPALIRSALGVGVTWAVETKIVHLAEVSLQRDQDIEKPNNNKTMEDDRRSEDDDKNPDNPA